MQAQLELSGCIFRFHRETVVLPSAHANRLVGGQTIPTGAGRMPFLGFPVVDSGMSQMMRAHDWSTSPLGRPDTWDRSLRTTVGLMLGSKFPMFIAWGPDLAFLYNDAYAPILGNKHPGALGRPFQEVWSEIWSDVSPLAKDAMAGRATWQDDLPLVMRRKGYDEETFFTFSYSPAYDTNGKIAGIFCACNETTARVVAERDLREREVALAASVEAREDLLRQKDLLLAEVNHRVKNSLQLVVSALSLQSRRLKDPATKIVFEQAITRVRAITSVHERLYKSDNPLVVEMQSYLRGLADDLAGPSELRDRMVVEVDQIDLRTERAIPVALIVNELVTNALKYAYPADRPGPVMLTLKKAEGGMLVLSVSDEGTGMSSTTTGGGLGTRLIAAMAAQLGGDVDREAREDGYRVSITFPQELA